MNDGRPKTTRRLDFQLIESFISEGASVLDLGCGDGQLPAELSEAKGCHVYGIEIDERAVRECIQRGVPVFHGDMLEGMSFYPDQAFDLVILSQTLQQVLHPAQVIRAMLRVGQRAIVSFRNSGYWRTLLPLLLRGQAPGRCGLRADLASQTPDVRLCTAPDFRDLCEREGLAVEAELLLAPGGRRVGRFLAGWRADLAVFVMRRS